GSGRRSGAIIHFFLERPGMGRRQHHRRTRGMTDKILKVAILGGGKMAGQHAAAIATLKSARLVAVADPVVAEEDLRARFGSEVKIYRDAEALLREVSPDVVHIVTPPG